MPKQGFPLMCLPHLPPETRTKNQIHTEYISKVVVICCLDNPYTVGLTTLVEAFALGLPVICSRNPKFQMDIEKERAGIYVDYNDTEGWKQAIRYLYTHPEEAQQMGANGRKLAEREYNLEHYSRELSQILTTTVKTYRKQP